MLKIISEINLQVMNLSFDEARIFVGNSVYTLLAKGLAPDVTRSSAAMVLTMYDKWVLTIHDK